MWFGCACQRSLGLFDQLPHDLSYRLNLSDSSRGSSGPDVSSHHRAMEYASVAGAPDPFGFPSPDNVEGQVGGRRVIDRLREQVLDLCLADARLHVFRHPALDEVALLLFVVVDEWHPGDPAHFSPRVSLEGRSEG